MKILTLSFQNINSLIGASHIDFTRSVFTDDGLFAITGKTGAGKSSILDAVSLALYGKTPRVEITGSENAVMTRGEKGCFAEIVFEVAGKKWKSAWAQERTRTGNLKPVSRRIADANDKIIADQVRTCDTKIVEILGLTFEQFTKVVMLAQGSFTAFLQADKNDKGQLLEQITGTEIYGEISKKAFDRNKIENQKLENIQLELGQIKILSDEEIKNINDEIVAFENHKILTDKEIQRSETAIKWLTDLAECQRQMDEAQLILPELMEKAAVAKATLEQTEKDVKRTKEEQETLKPIFTKVRELDTKIAEKQKTLQSIADAISKLETATIERSGTIENEKNDLEKKQKTREEKQRWAAENSKYEDLVGNFRAIEHENRLLLNSLAENGKLKSEIDDLRIELGSKKSALQNASDVFGEKDKKLNTKTTELETLKVELSQIFGNKTFGEYQQEKENIQTFGTQIKSLIDVEKAILKNKKEIVAYAETVKDAEKSENELSEKIVNNKEKQKNIDNQVKLLTENINLALTIKSLEQHRLNLKDGEACPLCGAKSHPYAVENVPQMDEKEKKLESLKIQFKEVTDTIQNGATELAILQTGRANALKNTAKENESLSENMRLKAEIWSEIKILQPHLTLADNETNLELLEKIRSEKQNEYLQINKIINEISSIETAIAKLRDKEIPWLQLEKQTTEKAKNSAETAEKLTAQQLQTKLDLEIKMQEKYQAEHAVFLKKLANYGVENMTDLNKCFDAWNYNKRQTEELDKQITELDKAISLSITVLSETKKQLDTKHAEKQAVEKEKDQLAEERKEIFAEKQVEIEEYHIQTRVNNAENTRAKAAKEHVELNTELAKNQAVATEKEKEISEKKALNITYKTREELQVELNEQRAKTDLLSEQIGANRQELTSNEQRLKECGSKLKELEKQQQSCHKWGALNELIGASDGKKYRNFAQALTFEHLIGLANRQLKKMSERYLLKRTGDHSNPFELSVIDKFQNNDERTAQNLSGGEKFIVSLSLALGLANMASKNMRIDTMFIDEGFGTLDNDYLDVAISALSNLQSEGKIIGVISHLAELKERIATHIDVSPMGNGHSKIQITPQFSS